ncbi:NAD(P)-binding protein [Rhizodiscina lignyota]|uniref:NAD(P)-binding protein n=1 Tax=Rhizodiscina lignyota TaxID=1504668 RepID=A0A9P4I4D2_9PEZI|nr:NAD(P)-binding protein [Rhizodiscina lignyota]
MAHPSFTPTYHTKPYAQISASNPHLSCKGKVAFITGGGRGIGRSIARAFAIAGAKVFIIGRSEASLKDTWEELSKVNESSDPADAAYMAADACDRAAVKSALDAAMRLFGSIDILVNNAGYLDANRSIVDSDFDDYWRCYEVNVKAGIIIAQEFLHLAQPGATYINISSGAAHIPYIQNFSAYSSSKMAFARIVEFMQGENPELRVFNVQPGALKTDMQLKAPHIQADDHIDLPGGFCVWLTSSDADFLKGRFVWVNWDVDEMLKRKDDILKNDLLRLRLSGWPRED